MRCIWLQTMNEFIGRLTWLVARLLAALLVVGVAVVATNDDDDDDDNSVADNGALVARLVAGLFVHMLEPAPELTGANRFEEL